MEYLIYNFLHFGKKQPFTGNFLLCFVLYLLDMMLFIIYKKGENMINKINFGQTSLTNRRNVSFGNEKAAMFRALAQRGVKKAKEPINNKADLTRALERKITNGMQEARRAAEKEEALRRPPETSNNRLAVTA